jgi:tetratricopeptide (TPR) repeat protein
MCIAMATTRKGTGFIRILGVTLLLVTSAGLAAGAEGLGSLDEARTLRLAGDLSGAREKAEQILKSDVDPAEAIAVHLELAKIHDRVGLHNNSRPVAEALQNIEAAKVLLKAGDPESAAAIQLALGDYYYRAEMSDRLFARATRHVDKAIEMFRELGDTRGQADAVHRRGLIHLQKDELLRARDLFDESLRLDEMNGGRVWFRGEYERHIGFVYQLGGDFKSALPHYQRSLQARIESGAIDASMFAATILAGALIELGRPEEAIAHAEYALSVAARINSPTGRARGKQILERVEAATGQTDGQ